jgi:hypothetical protein
MESNWQGYLNALGKSKVPQDTKDFPLTEGNTISTGFIEWKAKKDDPMSLKWNSVQSANAKTYHKSEFQTLNK